jgi:hypothetical protein
MEPRDRVRPLSECSGFLQSGSLPSRVIFTLTKHFMCHQLFGRISGWLQCARHCVHAIASRMRRMRRLFASHMGQRRAPSPKVVQGAAPEHATFVCKPCANSAWREHPLGEQAQRRKFRERRSDDGGIRGLEDAGRLEKAVCGRPACVAKLARSSRLQSLCLELASFRFSSLP